MCAPYDTKLGRNVLEDQPSRIVDDVEQCGRAHLSPRDLLHKHVYT